MFRCKPSANLSRQDLGNPRSSFTSTTPTDPARGIVRGMEWHLHGLAARHAEAPQRKAISSHNSSVMGRDTFWPIRRWTQQLQPAGGPPTSVRPRTPTSFPFLSPRVRRVLRTKRHAKRRFCPYFVARLQMLRQEGSSRCIILLIEGVSNTLKLEVAPGRRASAGWLPVV